MITGAVERARGGLAAIESLDRLDGSGSEPSQADLEVLRGWAG